MYFPSQTSFVKSRSRLLLFAETKVIIEKTTTTATRNCVVVSFILIIFIVVIKADMKSVKSNIFCISFPSLFFSLSLSYKNLVLLNKKQKKYTVAATIAISKCDIGIFII